MRAIEKKILACLEAGKEGQHKLSNHDLVTIHLGSKSYRLWGTELYYKSKEGVEYFYFSNHAADTRDCMSATTASRINALMCDKPCSVYRREGKLYERSTGDQILTNCMYKLVDGQLIPMMAVPK